MNNTIIIVIIIIVIIIILALIPTITMKLIDSSTYDIYRYIYLILLFISYFALFYGTYLLIKNPTNKQVFKYILLGLWLIYIVYNMYTIYSVNYRGNKLLDVLDPTKIKDINIENTVRDANDWMYDIEHYTLYSVVFVILLVIITLFYNLKIAGLFAVRLKQIIPT